MQVCGERSTDVNELAMHALLFKGQRLAEREKEYKPTHPKISMISWGADSC